MNEESDKHRSPLSQEERDQIFHELILPDIVTGSLPATNRTFVAICAQPGAGKSTMVRDTKDRFKRERSISLCVDDLFSYLPGFNAARLEGAGWGDARLHERAAISQWVSQALGYGLEHKTHIILESCYDEQSRAQSYKKKGFSKAELYIIATDKLTSLTSVFSRAVCGFKNKSMASCAVMDKHTHDEVYAKMPKIAFEVESSGSFDKIALATRDNGICYENDVVERTKNGVKWRKPPEAFKQLILLNNGLFTQTKIDQLNTGWKEIMAAGLREFQDYPLESYKNAVLSHVNRPGAQFNPKVVLPKDRADERNSYLRILLEDLEFIDGQLDRSKQSDRRLSNKLEKIYYDCYHDTTTKLRIGNRWRKDIDKAVLAEKAAEAAAPPSSSPPRDSGSPSDRQSIRRLQSSMSSDGSGFGTLHLTTSEFDRFEQAALDAQGHASDSGSYGSLHLTASEFDRLERAALDAQGHANSGPNKRPQELLVEDQAPPAKRPGYEVRLRDQPGRT